MAKRVMRDVKGVDRISDLPENIKLEILSRLDIRDAIRTSVLSRTWRHEWNALPYFNFGSKVLPLDVRREDLHLFSSLNKGWLQEIYRKKHAFLDFLDQALLIRSSKGMSCILQKLSIFVPISQMEIASHVDKWLACAMECGVRKLHLIICAQRQTFDNIYQFPESIFQAYFLTSLKLSNCKFISNNPYMVRLSSLKKLSLFMVYVNERTLRGIINCSISIKELSLVYCFGFDKFEVSGAPKLEKVEVSSTRGLEKIFIDLVYLRALVVEECSSLGQFNVAMCKNITKLRLCQIALTDDKLSFLLSELYLLEDLCLINCDYLKNIKISTQILKYISVKYCHNVLKVEVDAPNLESFTYEAKNMPLLSKVIAILALHNVRPTIFDHSLNLTLSIIPMSVFIPDKVRSSFRAPLLTVEHMKLQMSYPIKFVSVADVIDSILWLSHHPGSITLFSNGRVIKFYFKYKRLIDSGAETDQSCCSCIPVKCWRHSLRKVKIKDLEDTREAAELKTLFESSETLEMIEGLP